MFICLDSNQINQDIIKLEKNIEKTKDSIQGLLGRGLKMDYREFFLQFLGNIYRQLILDRII